MIKLNYTNIPGCVVLEPLIYRDNRGLFTEIYKESALPSFKPVQSNCSVSKSGVLRGIHRTPYAKLVTCVQGKIYDVCVDLRKDRETYRQNFGLELTPNNMLSLYIPPYCGHAFLALEDSIVIYHQDGEYNSIRDETYCYKNYNIAWPLEPTIISNKDSQIC